MMDNRCPICGQFSQEYQQQRSWTESDKYHGVKKFGLKQGVGFVAGQIADTIVPGSGTFVSMAAKSLTGDYYDENHPKSKTHYYDYRFYQCHRCSQEWTKDSDGMKMIDDYYAGQYSDYEAWNWLTILALIPYFALITVIMINAIIVLLIAFLWIAFWFMSAIMPLGPSASFDGFGDMFTSSWWPTLGWIADYAVWSWKFYVIYVPIVFLLFCLPPLIHNNKIDNIVNEKKQALANRLAGTN